MKSAIISALTILFSHFSSAHIQAQITGNTVTKPEHNIRYLNAPLRHGYVYDEPYKGQACPGEGVSVYSTLEKDSVVSVLPGVVVQKVWLDSSSVAVILKHNKGFTTYCGAAGECLPEKGDTIQQNQFLFCVQRDKEEKKAVLTFIIFGVPQKMFAEDTILWLKEQLPLQQRSLSTATTHTATIPSQSPLPQPPPHTENGACCP